MLGSEAQAGSVVLLALALIPGLASGVLSSILNAHHRVGALAKLAITNSVLGAATTILLIWRWREQGIAPAVLATSCVNFLAAWYYLRRAGCRPNAPVTRTDTVEAARSLLRFGGPYTASMLVGTGVQFIMPALVLHTLGRENVGYFRAALAIAVTYIGFLATAMAQDYYPRVSAARDDPAALVGLINQQHRMVMLVAVPVILAVLALSRVIVVIIYSRQFLPAVEVLEWQLIGDVFKFSAWTMSFVVLARCGSLTFFCTELLGGSTMLVVSILGMRWMGLAGLGVGFLVVGVVYYLVVWLIMRRSVGLRWTPDNSRMMAVAVLAAVGIHFAGALGSSVARLALPLAVVAVLCAFNLRALLHELRAHPLRPSEPSAA